MPHMEMDHEVDPKDALLATVGDVSNVEIFNNDILVVIYLRPQKTKSGIYLTQQTTDEDRFQSKVGIVAKLGPSAFVDESNAWFAGADIKVGDLVVFKPSDGWSITVNGTLCRILDDTSVRGRIDQPDRVW